MRRNRKALFGALALVFWFGAGTLPGLAQAVTSSSGFKLDGKEPIEIESDRLEVRDRENVAIFSGNVTLIQGKLLLKTVKMTVYYTGEGAGGPTTTGTDIKRMEAEGRVYLKQGEQVATGDYGTFDIASGVMTLTGKEVVLTEGDNIVVGCKLTAHMNTGQSQLDGCARGGQAGRVKMLLQPGSQNR